MLTAIDYIFGYLLLGTVYLGMTTFMLAFGHIFDIGKVVKDSPSNPQEVVTTVIGGIFVLLGIIALLASLLAPGVVVNIYSNFLFGSDLFTDAIRISVLYNRIADLFSGWGTSSLAASAISIISLLAWLAGFISSLISIYEFIKKQMSKT